MERVGVLNMTLSLWSYFKALLFQALQIQQMISYIGMRVPTVMQILIESWFRSMYILIQHITLHSITWMVVFHPPHMQMEVQPLFRFREWIQITRLVSLQRRLVIGLSRHSNSQLVRQQIR